MKIVSGLLELVVIIASAVLIRWGALSRGSTGELTREQKRMTSIGLMLLLSWVVLAGIPGFIRNVRESGELKRFKNNGYKNGNQINSDHEKRKHDKKKKKHGKPSSNEIKRKFAGK